MLSSEKNITKMPILSKYDSEAIIEQYIRDVKIYVGRKAVGFNLLDPEVNPPAPVPDDVYVGMNAVQRDLQKRVEKRWRSFTESMSEVCSDLVLAVRENSEARNCLENLRTSLDLPEGEYPRVHLLLEALRTHFNPISFMNATVKLEKVQGMKLKHGTRVGTFGTLINEECNELEYLRGREVDDEERKGLLFKGLNTKEKSLEHLVTNLGSAILHMNWSQTLIYLRNDDDSLLGRARLEETSKYK
jgi:hypothetical protein